MFKKFYLYSCIILSANLFAAENVLIRNRGNIIKKHVTESFESLKNNISNQLDFFSNYIRFIKGEITIDQDLGDSDNLFLQAIAAGNLEFVSSILDEGSQNLTDFYDEYGNTPLHIALECGHISLAEYLVTKGADINAKNNYGMQPIHIAASNGYLSVVDLLVTKGVDINANNEYGFTPLHIASFSGYLSVVEYLVTKGAKIDAKDSKLMTPLHYASQESNLPIAEYLVTKDADINAKDDYGNTPLHTALKNKNFDIALLLLSKNAHVNYKSKYGQYPIHLLVNAKYDESAKNAYDESKDILRNELVLKLKEKTEFDINVQDSTGNTALHIAILNKDNEMIKLLLENGSDVNIKNNSGQYPYQLAIANGIDKEIVDLIYSKTNYWTAGTIRTQKGLKQVSSWLGFR